MAELEPLTTGITFSGKGAIIPDDHIVGRWLSAPHHEQRGLSNGDVLRTTKQLSRGGVATWRMSAKRVPAIIKAYEAAPKIPVAAPAANECVICLDAPADHVCVPCGHACLCDLCRPPTHICPLCSHKIDSVLKVYNV
mgnify:CR=1 FL=1